MNPRAKNLKTIVSGLYDLQKLRIQSGNRLVGNIKAKMGQEPSKPESDIPDPAAQKLLDQARKTYRLMSEGLTLMTTKQFEKHKGTFDDYTEYCLTGLYTNVYDQEQSQIARLESLLIKHPIYTEFLTDVLGCGPMMSAVIISGYDIHTAKYPSSFHMYTGLDVIDGEGRTNQKKHLVDVQYKSKKTGKMETKKSITYNPWLKTKIVGVLGASFIKQSASKCIYRKIYDDYKHRLQNHKAHKNKSKGHIHAMANRYMIKRFLTDLWLKWRELENLPLSLPYEEAKLGYQHTHNINPAVKGIYTQLRLGQVSIVDDSEAA